jgi:hypothetical protein
MELKKVQLILIVVFLANLSRADFVTAEMYQWSDSDGAVHFSDNPMSIPKGERPLVRQDITNAEKEPVQKPVQKQPLHKKFKKARKATKSFDRQTDTTAGNTPTAPPLIAKENRSSYDPTIEAQIKIVWKSFRNALARQDAETALGMICSEDRTEFKEVFKALGAKMPLLNNELGEIELISRDESRATCRMLGKGSETAPTMDFVKENGIWKITKF